MKELSYRNSNFGRKFLTKFKINKSGAVSLAATQEYSTLTRSLCFASHAMERMATEMYNPNQMRWKRSFMGYTFSLSRCGGGCADNGEGTSNLLNALKAWLRAHEEAQVMMASVLVVVGIWWLVRTILALIINLICPLFVVLVAVILVPQLRAPLLGQNYPALANVVHSILLRMAENIKEN